MQVLNLGAEEVRRRMKIALADPLIALDPYEKLIAQGQAELALCEEIQHLQIVEAVYWNRTRQCALEVTKYARLATQASAAIQRLAESAWENQKGENV